MENKIYLVLDIGGTNLKYAYMQSDFTILEKNTIVTPKESKEALFLKIYELTKAYENVAGVAIALPGVIDKERGFMVECGALPFNAHTYFRQELSDFIHLPVSIENDGKAAGLAELYFGELKGFHSAIVLVLGTAIGGCVIIDSKIIRGSSNFAGEFSCMITKNRSNEFEYHEICQDISVPKMIEAVRLDKNLPTLDGETYFKLLKEDVDLMKYFDTYCLEVATLIYNLACILDPQKIVLGGGVSVQPLLLDKIYPYLEEFYRAAKRKMPDQLVGSCQFNNDSNLLGALLNYYLEQQLTIPNHLQ